MSAPKIETPFQPKTKSGHVLTPKQERFCHSYVYWLGDAVEAALEAYNINPENKYARAQASGTAKRCLLNPVILERIKEIFEEKGLNDEIADVEIAFLARQRSDLSAKAKGLDLYNKIAGRYKEDNRQKQPQNIIVVGDEKRAEIKKSLEDL